MENGKNFHAKPIMLSIFIKYLICLELTFSSTAKMYSSSISKGIVKIKVALANTFGECWVKQSY